MKAHSIQHSGVKLSTLLPTNNQMKNVGKVQERCMHIFLFMYNAYTFFTPEFITQYISFIDIYKMNNWEFDNPSMLVAFTSLPILPKIVYFVKLIFLHIVTHGMGFVCKFILLMDMFVSNINSIEKSNALKMCLGGNVSQDGSHGKEICG